MIYQGGAGLVPVELQGLSHILVNILDEGPSGMTNMDYKRRLFLWNAEIVFSISSGSLNVKVVAPPDDFEKAVTLARSIIAAPRLEQEMFDRKKRIVLSR